MIEVKKDGKVIRRSIGFDALTRHASSVGVYCVRTYLYPEGGADMVVHYKDDSLAVAHFASLSLAFLWVSRRRSWFAKWGIKLIKQTYGMFHFQGSEIHATPKQEVQPA